jgi:hypothetical protein
VPWVVGRGERSGGAVVRGTVGDLRVQVVHLPMGKWAKGNVL